jgi:hypothetical protein
MSNRVISRETLIQKLQKAYPQMNCKLTEDFNGDEGGVWLSGEDGIEDRNGLPIFDYYAESNLYVFGVIDHLHNFADRNGWLFEWYDCGTMMVWKI